MLGWGIVGVIGIGLIILGICFQFRNETICYISIIIGMIAIICGLIWGIANPIIAKTEYMAFEETRIMIIEVYENNEETENYAISQSVIEANKWLSDAKADKKLWGIFSTYYCIDVENTEYISLPEN